MEQAILNITLLSTFIVFLIGFLCTLLFYRFYTKTRSNITEKLEEAFSKEEPSDEALSELAETFSKKISRRLIVIYITFLLSVALIQYITVNISIHLQP